MVANVERCTTLDPKMPGDRVYMLGETRNELGASEYYDMLGYVGCNVPKVYPERFLPLYRALANAITQGLVASVHGLYRGGLGVHLAMAAMAGDTGLTIDLSAILSEGPLRDDALLYSESAGRFIVTVDPGSQAAFERAFDTLPCACIGSVVEEKALHIDGSGGDRIIDITVPALRAAWQKPFGDLI